jgi:ppGpp synthetase/RelA/SpoT-type nucleotidyltranferase
MHDEATKAYQPLSNDEELIVRRGYQDQQEALEALGVSVRHIAESALKKSEIPFHSVKYRVKSISPVLEKIARKQYGPNLSKFTDLVGIRVICLSPSHLDPVIHIIEDEFNVLEIVDKRPRADSQQFGYSSIHLVCKVKDTERGKLTEFSALADTAFEIQVRTILQEAWSEMDHRLVYKTQTAAPAEIQRLITRLSIALESADELFQQIFDRRRDYVNQLEQTKPAQLVDEPLNIDSLNEVMRRVYPWAHGWKEDRDQEYLSQNLNFLLKELDSVGIKSAGQLTSVLEKWRDTVSNESKEAFKVASKPPVSENTHKYALPTSAWQVKTGHFYVPLGLVRKSLGHEFPNYRPPGQPAALPVPD